MTGTQKARRGLRLGRLATGVMFLVGFVAANAAAYPPTVIAPVTGFRPVPTPEARQSHVPAQVTPEPSRRPVEVPRAFATVPPTPRPTPAPPRYRRKVVGIASRMGSGYGPSYLALPGGPGIRVTICGAATCWKMVSTDAGPDLAMQRAGRVADLNDWVWHKVTGLPLLRGLGKVTILYL